MSALPVAALQSWSLPMGTSLAVGIALVLYLRGWRQLKRSRPEDSSPSRPVAFASGLAVFWLAIASPLDAFTNLLLSAHMVQHLLLMSIAPPLMLIAAPVVPLLRGLPGWITREVLGPFIAWPAAQRLGRVCLHPAFCWILMSFTLLAWHVPATYELALHSPSWHRFEHASFLASSLLFWWPVVAPWPTTPRWPRLAMPLYLLAANVVMSVLGAWLTFAADPIYATYAMAPRIAGLSPLDDQRLAGLLMWIPGSAVYLVPAVAITIAALSPRPGLSAPRGVRLQADQGRLPAFALRARARSRRSLGGGGKPAPTATARRPAFDLLRVPVLGRILRAQLFRRVLQSAALVAVVAVIVDGLFGHPMGGMNLAGVVPWIYGRGLFVLALLAAGNLFCFACPFTLPRELGRRLRRGTRRWPHWLQAKWVAAGLLVLFFATAETFAVWDVPRWTALIMLAYFVTAFVVDSLFRGATFCKFVCPVGQFSFVASFLSPFEVKVRRPETCATCTTADCLCGNTHTHGCGMDLFLPRKAGSVDCTFCLDCVRACPHDNVGVIAVIPAATLVRDVHRSSVGRLSRRLDLAGLALVVVLAAFTSAAVMVLPRSPLTVIIAALPALGLAASILVKVKDAGHRGRATGQLTERFCLFSLALVPLGLAMWAAHLSFHLNTAWRLLWPVMQRVTGDIGVPLLGLPEWTLRPLVAGETLLTLQFALLDVGLLATLYLAWRVVQPAQRRSGSLVALLSPVTAIAVALYAAGAWILVQPMSMQGMGHG